MCRYLVGIVRDSGHGLCQWVLKIFVSGLIYFHFIISHENSLFAKNYIMNLNNSRFEYLFSSSLFFVCGSLELEFALLLPAFSFHILLNGDELILSCSFLLADFTT